MRGTILDVDVQKKTGLISGGDGKRYAFTGSEWNALILPLQGMKVDFEPQDGNAMAIYLALDERPLGYRGLYRSSDEAQVVGVCAGLAHRSGINCLAARLIFVGLGCFYFLGVGIYIVLALVLKAVPTKDVRIGKVL